jgi:hypothetical protein
MTALEIAEQSRKQRPLHRVARIGITVPQSLLLRADEVIQR